MIAITGTGMTGTSPYRTTLYGPYAVVLSSHWEIILTVMMTGRERITANLPMPSVNPYAKDGAITDNNPYENDLLSDYAASSVDRPTADILADLCYDNN